MSEPGQVAAEAASGAVEAGQAGVPDELPSGSPVEALEAALGMLPDRQALPLPRWLGPLAVCCIVGMLPWIVFLGLTLPQRSDNDHYDISWVGFDCFMWIVLAALAYSALRRLPATGPLAAVAATMLCLDAWFDILASDSKGDLALAILLAVVAELPLAVLCAWVSINAERIRARSYTRLRLRWLAALDLARKADARAEAAASAAVTLAAGAAEKAGAALPRALPPRSIPPASP